MNETQTESFDVKINCNLLERLRRMSDWQLTELGFDPHSVTMACQETEGRPVGRQPKFFPSCS